MVNSKAKPAIRGRSSVKRAKPAPMPDIPAAFDLEKHVPYLMNRVGVGIGVAFSAHLRRFGITLPGYRVLGSLSWRDGQTILGLAKHTSIDVSTLSRLINNLEEKGLVRRQRDARDARSIKLFLLPEGRLLASQTIPTGMLLERIVTSGFSDDEITALKDMLTRMYVNLASLPF